MYGVVAIFSPGLRGHALCHRQVAAEAGPKSSRDVYGVSRELLAALVCSGV